MGFVIFFKGNILWIEITTFFITNQLIQKHGYNTYLTNVSNRQLSIEKEENHDEAFLWKTASLLVLNN